MQVPAALMDHPAPKTNPGLQLGPQGATTSHMYNLMGPPESQLLQSDLLMDNLTQENWETSAQAQLEANLITSAETPGSSRTRARRATQPAANTGTPIVLKSESAKKIKAPVKRKRTNRQVNIVCTGCYRGNSPSNNFIVLCDGCDDAWHQKCHNPNISNEVIEIPDMNWFCTKCNPSQRPKAPKQPPKKPSRPKKIMPQKISATSAPRPQPSEQQRRAYLSSLPHDELVQLLLKISDEWPLVPIFPSNMPMASAPALNPPATTTIQPQVPATPTETMAQLASFVRTPVRISYAESSGSDLLTDDDSDFQSRAPSPAPRAASQHEDDYDSEDYRAYPEAGHGFQVPMSVADLDIMAEDEDYPTFSHSIRGSRKVQGQILEPFAH